MEFHAWPFIVVCGCVVQLISWLNEKAISKWGVALCTLSLNIFLALTASQKPFETVSSRCCWCCATAQLVWGVGVCVCIKVCVRDGGINISINVATVPASEFPETASKYVVQREFRLWKTPGKLLYLCALILQAQSFRRSFAFPLLMAAPFCCRSRSHCRCCYTPYTWHKGRRGLMEWKLIRKDVSPLKSTKYYKLH